MSLPLSCPLPPPENDRIVLAHGGGGTLTDSLVRDVFLSAFGPSPAAPHDASPLPLPPDLPPGAPLLFTTDAHVVQPLFFPGGDIGTLAVNGTLNDLLVSGARPLALSAAFLLGEGLPIATLRRVVASMAAAARAVGVRIVAGDTKVLPRNPADPETLCISTSGVGTALSAPLPRPEAIRPGDAILLTGDIGRHGTALLAARHALAFAAPLESDCACLAAPLLDLHAAGIPLHCARDATRGGLAGILAELAAAAHVETAIDEAAVPVLPPVRAACDLLGLDPWHLANEGCAVLFLPESAVEPALAVLRRHPVSAAAARIGTCRAAAVPGVVARTPLGTDRRILPPAGELLPRIC